MTSRGYELIGLAVMYGKVCYDGGRGKLDYANYDGMSEDLFNKIYTAIAQLENECTCKDIK